MKKNSFLVIILLFVNAFLFAQSPTPNDCTVKSEKRADNWYFFENSGLKFGDAGVAFEDITSQNVFARGKGCTAISDEDGNLLYLSDGMRLWNRNFQQIANGLKGNLGATQSSLLVPFPNNPNAFCLFTIDLLIPKYPSGYITNGLSYSTISNSENGGAGGLSWAQNVPLLPYAAEKITAVRNNDSTAYWVIAHPWDSDEWDAFKIDTILHTTPVKSNIGWTQTGSAVTKDPIGFLKASPDGKKMACAIMGQNIVEIYDFDNKTGNVSNLVIIPAGEFNSFDDTYTYSVEFSPNGRYLYVTTVKYNNVSDNNYLYQFDLQSSNIPSSKTLINNGASLKNSAKDMLSLQLAPDGRIYVGRYNSDTLGVINNPNWAGIDCSYDQKALVLDSKRTIHGFPNFVQSFFDVPFFKYDTRCFKETTYFQLNNESDEVVNNGVSWDFGDPNSGTNNLSADLRPTHVFSAPGNYTVTVTQNAPSGNQYSFSREIKINVLPEINLPDSIYLYPGSYMNLDGGANNKIYEWRDSTGQVLSDQQILKVNTPGYYSVMVESHTCCVQYDTIKVVLFDFRLPNAFTPNNDGLNDKFRALGPNNGIRNFNLSVYDRLGTLVFQTNDVLGRWDGMYKNQPCPSGVYTWSMSFNVSGSVEGVNKVTKKGCVTLLR